MFLQLVRLYPLIWVTGIAIAFWPILICTLMSCLKYCRPNLLSNLLLLVGVFELISIPIGLLSFQIELDRILSALVNSLIWITSSLLVSYQYSNSQVLHFSKSLINIGLVQGAIVLLARIVFPGLLPFPILHKFMQAFGANSGAFSSNVVVYQDWLFSSTLRTHGIMANATWAGGFSALSLVLLIATQERRIYSILRNLYKYFLLIHVIFLSLSRSVLLSLLLSSLIGILLRVSNKLIPEIRIAFKQIIIIVIVSLTIISLNTGQFNQTIKSINQSRSGSLETRSDIYAVTARLVKDHPFPAIGYGIKPTGEGLVASIATHSTPLGILFKGGLFGLVAYISFLIFGLKKLVTTKNYLGLVMFNFIIMWSILEDFDGGHLIPLFLGLVFQPKLLEILRN